MLEAKNLKFWYDTGDAKKPILNIPKFRLIPNKVNVLIGENGSGKSTLLKILAGHLPAKEGSLFLNKKALPNAADLLIRSFPEVAYLNQHFALDPNLTVEQTFRRALLKYSNSYKQEKAFELLTLAKLFQKRNLKTSELSGGEKQKLSLCLLLAQKPKIILLDEPFSHADPSTFQTWVLEVKKILASRAVTSFWVLHHAQYSLSFGDVIWALEKGRIKKLGSPQEAYYSPPNQSLGELLGPLNSLSIDLFKNLGGSPKPLESSVLVRPSMLSFSTQAIENSIVVEVKNQYFQGEITLLEVYAAPSTTPIWVSHSGAFPTKLKAGYIALREVIFP